MSFNYRNNDTVSINPAKIRLLTKTMRILFVVLAFLYSSALFSQLNQNGYPFIRNYSPKENGAQGMNYAVAMDSRGIIYFGNTDKGVIEYDGTTWKHIALSNNSACKSLAVDTNDIIYVGGVGDFGYIAPDKNGVSKYNSLTYLVDTSQVKLSNIWKTYATRNGVYFCSVSYIFHYKYPEYLEVIKLDEGSFFSFNIGSRIIIGNWRLGLLELKGDKAEVMPGIEPLIDQDIVQVMPYKAGQWLVVTYKGLFVYDFIEKKTMPLTGQSYLEATNQTLINSRPYNGCFLKDIGYTFATISNGILISDKKTRISENYNVSTGLIDESVSDVLYSPSQGVIFASFFTGLSRIEYNSPFRIFAKESNLNGTVLCAQRVNGTLYAGTVTGVSYLTFKENGLPWFKEIEQLKGKFVYVLLSVETEEGKSRLMACASDDIYEIRDNQAYPLGATEVTTYCAIKSSVQPKTFFVGCPKGVHKISWNGSKWEILKIDNTDYEVSFQITEDAEGNIWAGTAINGLLKISKDNTVTIYTTKEGLPTNSDLSLFYFQGKDKLLAGSRSGLYEFNAKKNVFEKSQVFGDFDFQKNAYIRNMYNGYLGSKFILLNNRIQKISPHYESYLVDSVVFNRLPEMSIEGIYTENNGISWICTSEGLISYNNLFKPVKTSNIPVRISSVTLQHNDSVIFSGNFIKPIIFGKDTLWVPVKSQPALQTYSLAYRHNNLSFYFSYPYFQNESANSYSYMLEGFDNSWSKWSTESKAVFTNLSEGTYTFRVKARNVYLEESQESSFSFTIFPPWYRTIWAYLGYVVVGLFFLVVTVKLYTRKLEADKKRLEGIVAERTAEVVKQKDEILEKNIEIEHKNKDITDSIVYAKRIQEALLPVRDQINIPSVEIFVYFRPKDIVSGDFYFMRQVPRSSMLVAAAADCTGHGVPGAFMSMLGMSFLSELIAKPEIQHSDELLNYLREHIIVSLNPKGKETETKDGMDISLVAYNYETNQLEWSGANNPLYLVRNGELIEYKADKMPIGLHDRRNEPFKRIEIEPLHGDIIYLFSDGFADQFGGEKGRKYMSKNMKEYLLSIHQKPLEEQEKLIAEESTRWRGEIEQIDDQIVMGIRFI
jgi:serine phosphatase RsbU (regulator of sigma subunit)/ligand-binding sensor domain-containing protein